MSHTDPMEQTARGPQDACASPWKAEQIASLRSGVDELAALCIKDDPIKAARLAREVIGVAQEIQESAVSAAQEQGLLLGEQ